MSRRTQNVSSEETEGRVKPKISVGGCVLISFVALVAFVVLVFFSIGNTFEPLDPLPRANESVKCPDGSSVVFYRKKAGWFTEQTQLSVTLVDKSGKVINTQSLGTFSHWVDSEMKVLETPQIFCDQKYWSRLLNFKAPELDDHVATYQTPVSANGGPAGGENSARRTLGIRAKVGWLSLSRFP